MIEKRFNTGFGINQSVSGGGIMPIWLNLKDLQVEVSGANVSNAPDFDVMIPGGTPIEYDAEALTAKLCIRLEVYEDAASDAVEYKVKKDYGLIYAPIYNVGTDIMKMPTTLTGTGAAYDITDIDTSSPLYDVITLSTTLGAATAGDILAEADDNGASGNSLLAVANRLMRDQVYHQGTLQDSCAPVYFGNVYANRIPKLSAEEMANMPQINFSPLK